LSFFLLFFFFLPYSLSVAFALFFF
jgi:hypothetical protein